MVFSSMFRIPLVLRNFIVPRPVAACSSSGFLGWRSPYTYSLRQKNSFAKSVSAISPLCSPAAKKLSKVLCSFDTHFLFKYDLFVEYILGGETLSVSLALDSSPKGRATGEPVLALLTAQAHPAGRRRASLFRLAAAANENKALLRGSRKATTCKPARSANGSPLWGSCRHRRLRGFLKK